VYCRRLNPAARIISRITHQRNMEAIHRAGADFVLSYTHLGIESLLASYYQREEVVVVVGLDLFTVDVPSKLSGKTVAEAAVGARTGLHIVAIEHGEGSSITPTGMTKLPSGAQLVVLGSGEQRREFDRLYGDG
jgi:voltage-gated potassium channel